MSDVQNIQWFPGHMAKTRRKIAESLTLVDAVAEIVDARIPASSRNPELAGILASKPVIILLNKADLADPAATERWVSYYKSRGVTALPVDCKSGKGMAAFLPAVRGILADRIAYYREKGMRKPLRVMVAGIPNAGKSSFINRLSKSGRARAEDRPGVTRGNQWYRVDRDLELLDTPGVLWPKFEDPLVGERLAFTGAVRDDILDIETLAARLLENLAGSYGQMLFERYQVRPSGENGHVLLEAVGRRRGMLVSGGEVDIERAAAMLLDEFRGCKIGRITLELPGDSLSASNETLTKD